MKLEEKVVSRSLVLKNVSTRYAGTAGMLSRPMCDVSSRGSYRAVTETKATKAARFLVAVGDWGAATRLVPTSPKGLCSVAYHKYTTLKMSEDGSHWARLSLAVSAPNVVEIHGLVANPVKAGIGTQTMRKLCALADELDLTLWLDAHPFGTVGVMLREPNLSLAKLATWYRSFGFFRISAPNCGWLNGFHRQYYRKFTHPMMRNPLPR